MTFKILGLAALMTIFAGTSNKALANEEAAPAVEMSEMATMDSEDATARHHDRDWRRPGWNRGRLVCYARNVTGRTFAAWGNWRTPAWFVQRAAMENCRRSSGFFRFSCRNLGCRRMW